MGLFGDYNVDGISSTAILSRYFSKLNLETFTYIPNRITENYGPNYLVLKTLFDKGTDIIFTLDCGTLFFNCLEQIAKKNIGVIVIDHHVSKNNLPDFISTINPNRIDEESPVKTLSAIGVVFLFLIALNKSLIKKIFFIEYNILKPDLIFFRSCYIRHSL